MGSAITTRSSATGIGVATGAAGATVIRLGGQSMFFAKLGVCDVVSSLWPMRVNPGTHTRTTTASSTEALARKYRYDRTGTAFNKGTFIYCSGGGQKEARETGCSRFSGCSGCSWFAGCSGCSGF